MPEWSVLWPQLGAEKPCGRWSARLHGNDVRPQAETHVRLERDNEGGVKRSMRRERQDTPFYLFIIDHVLDVAQCFCTAESFQLSIWQALFHAQLHPYNLSRVNVARLHARASQMVLGQGVSGLCCQCVDVTARTLAPSRCV